MKNFSLIIAAGLLMLACSKEEAPVVNPGADAETGAVVFNMNAPGYVVHNAPGLRNAAAPGSFDALTDIKALLFFGVNDLLAYNDDIMNSISWTGDNGSWTGDPLSKAVGVYRSLVVFNSAAMYDKANGGALSATTDIDNIRFHLAPESAYGEDNIVTGSDAIYEIAASAAIGSGTVTTANKTTPAHFGGEVKRINNKLNINMAYDQADMFPGQTTSTAAFRMAWIKIDGIPGSVDFNGANATGSVAVTRAFQSTGNAGGTEQRLNSDKTDKTKVGAADQVLSTLAFPFAAGAATLRIGLEYTVDGGSTWTTLNLAPYTIATAVGRNQVLNVNVFVLSLSGDVDYGFTFTDWDRSLDDVVLDGGEEE